MECSKFRDLYLKVDMAHCLKSEKKKQKNINSLLFVFMLLALRYATKTKLF